MKISNRITSMQASPIRKLVPYAEIAKEKGREVYHLNIGQPDIITPPEFMEQISNYHPKTIAYSHSAGENILREAISNYYQKKQLAFNPDDILITTGGSEALLFSLVACCDPGDNILIPEPFYTNYNGFSEFVNVEVKAIPTSIENGFHFPNQEAIEQLIDHKTKAILFSNPGNPTGVVYNSNELAMIKDIAIKHQLFVISDEVYREFTYDNQEFTSMATFKDLEDLVIIVDSISKRFSACGARIGSIASKNQGIIENILKLCQARLCVATLEQIGASALYAIDDTYFHEVNEEYNKRRITTYNALSKIKGVTVNLPSGAFYIMAKLPVENSEHFITWMLEEFEYENKTVMMAPANGFYGDKSKGLNEVRIAYVLNEQDLIDAIKILEIALTTYNSL